jgi:hypothetical protein
VGRAVLLKALRVGLMTLRGTEYEQSSKTAVLAATFRSEFFSRYCLANIIVAGVSGQRVRNAFHK